MKQYTDDEILDYARSHVRHIDQQKGKRFLLAFMVIGTVVLIVSLVSAYFEKCKKTGTHLFEDLNFFTGFAFGVGAVLFTGIGVVSCLRIYSAFYGKEIAVYRLLVKSSEETKTTANETNC